MKFTTFRSLLRSFLRRLTGLDLGWPAAPQHHAQDEKGHQHRIRKLLCI